jgi:hypothetical protein
MQYFSQLGKQTGVGARMPVGRDRAEKEPDGTVAS